MPGCRPLTQAETETLLRDGFPPDRHESFVGRFYVRMLLATGLRVSEQLTLRLGQLVRFTRLNTLLLDPQSGRPIPLGYIEVSRANLKGGKKTNSSVKSRRIQLGAGACEYIVEYVTQYTAELNRVTHPTEWVFPSRRGGHLAPRTMVDTLARAFRTAGLAHTGDRSLSNHSFRKTFAQAAYLAAGKDLVLTQQCMGHQRIDSTVKYLDVHREEVQRVQSEVGDRLFAVREVEAEELPVDDFEILEDIVDLR